MEHLFDDLASRQVTHYSIQAACAKDAPHGAADLRADADRASSLLADQHALDALIVGQGQQELFGAVFGATMERGFRRANVKLVR